MNHFKAAFVAAHPKAVDFSDADYAANEPEISALAAEHGYRLAGHRLGRAVFTTKPQQEEVS